jgi:hypothetical protein
MEELNTINKVLNGTIFLHDDKFDIIYNEIELTDILKEESITYNFESTEYLNDNTVLNNVLTRANSTTLLTSSELNSLNTNFNNSDIINLEGNNIRNYGLEYLSNLKLQIIDIMMINYDTYISTFNITHYFNNNLKNTMNGTNVSENQIHQFNDIFEDLIKNLNYGVIQSDEIYSYNSIITSNPFDIKTLKINNYNNYLINTDYIYYKYPLIIIVESNYTSLDTLKIKNILKITKINSQLNE